MIMLLCHDQWSTTIICQPKCKYIMVYGNPNMTKLSKFKFKSVKVQILHMEGCKRSNL